MYTIINRGYGLLFCDGYKYLHEDEAEIVSFLDDYAKIVDEENHYRIDWPFKQKVNYLQEMDYLESMYSGQNDEMIAFLGVSNLGWDTSQLSGQEGLIEFAKKENPTEDEVAEFEEISLEIRNLFLKYNIKPEIFWVESTS